MQIAIGTYDNTRALKDGRVTSPRISFDFIEVSPITRAFRHMAADLAYDVSEMALATYMLARAFDKPIVGLPIVLVRTSLLPGLVTAENSPIKDARELAGKTLGVRSYTQTSGVWVRGILQDAFGLDLSSLNWVTFEGAHLDEYTDPPKVSRAGADKNLQDMVQSGELAAGIGIPAGPGLRSVVPNAAQAEAEWASSSGVRTVNHIVVARQDLLEQDPGLKQELTDLFERAREGNGASVPPIGVAPNRTAFETLARYAHEQGVTPKQFTVDELFPA
jgi:4,5-dihydroxyphthalate decarboxylase